MENVFLIRLEPIVDLSTITSLHTTCKEAIASNLPSVHIDASSVERLKTPIFQLILSLQKTLQSQNREFQLISPSDSFLMLARCLGLHTALNLNSFQ